MQIHHHQPAFGLQESVAASQQLCSVAAWKFVQRHAELDGGELAIRQWRVLGKPFHELQFGMALGRQIESAWSDVQASDLETRLKPWGRRFTASTTQVKHRCTGTQLMLNRFQAESAKAGNTSNAQGRHGSDRVVDPAMAVSQRSKE
jgi:hypothetical protein